MMECSDSSLEYLQDCARNLVSYAQLGCSQQIEFPSLSRKILPKTVMLFFVHNAEPCLPINASGCVKNALRPEGDLLISGLPRESNALLNKPFANSKPARLPFHMQQPQLCDFVRCFRNKDGANPCSILFRNPAT